MICHLFLESLHFQKSEPSFSVQSLDEISIQSTSHSSNLGTGLKSTPSSADGAGERRVNCSQYVLATHSGHGPPVLGQLGHLLCKLKVSIRALGGTRDNSDGLRRLYVSLSWNSGLGHSSYSAGTEIKTCFLELSPKNLCWVGRKEEVDEYSPIGTEM